MYYVNICFAECPLISIYFNIDTQFPVSAALSVAEWLDQLAEKDLVQEGVWKELSSEYEGELIINCIIISR